VGSGHDRARRSLAVPDEVIAKKMKMRVGVDLVRVQQIEQSLSRFGDRFLRRLFTEGEIAYATSVPARAAERLAARFAAKEAVKKALGAAADSAVWRHIEVRRTATGSPEIALHGAAQEAAAAAGISEFSVSLSHDGDYAVAMVAAMCQGD
jgi:holo-[acyl-carrier protein] synthase